MLEESWVGVDAIAKHLGVSKETIYRWVDQKNFPVHRVGRLFRFRISEIDLWVQQGEQPLPSLPKILVVDDDEIERESLKRALQDKYDLTITSSPQEVLQLLKKNFFDILITDLMMMEMNGLDLVREAKKMNPNLTVIVITEYSKKDVVAEAWRAGAYDFLEKNLMPGNIQQSVGRAWGTIQSDLETRNLVAELKRKNEELKKVNDKLKEQIANTL